MSEEATLRLKILTMFCELTDDEKEELIQSIIKMLLFNSQSAEFQEDL